MKLLVDVSKDASLVKEAFGKLIPESADDAKVLVKELVSRFEDGGLSRENAVAALRSAADELGGQLVTAVQPVEQAVESQVPDYVIDPVPAPDPTPPAAGG
jgi:hypothetical protein